MERDGVRNMTMGKDEVGGSNGFAYPQEFFAPLNITVEAYHNYIKYPLACSPLGRYL